MTNTLPETHHWLNAETPCGICGQPVRFGDRFSTAEIMTRGGFQPAVCHEQCVLEDEADTEKHMSEHDIEEAEYIMGER